ncbi:hypothetical protein ACOXXX_18320 [Thalassococcus sp. BH17M4-6]|uniref:hypothetical protein n=1 Tax=Thalassococcus sp. BH17M4-6 TaxID=3413148 RepID=UPI003BDF2C97
MFRPIAPAALLPAAAALTLALPATAQNLIQSDTSIQSNLCVGAGCIETETWAEPVQESIVRIDNNRTRIEFVDASNPAGNFPTNDWSIFANDFVDFGASYLAVQDDETGNVPFRIDAGAPTAALHVGTNGRIGLGTILPQDTLHASGSFGPALRLEQTGNVLVPSQIWRIAGQTAFSIYDLTLGTTPFRIDAATPNSTLHLNEDGAVGLGTNVPAAALHLLRGDGSAGVLVEDTNPGVQEMFAMRNNGGSYFTLDNTASGTTWFFTHENAAPNRFIIADAVADGPEMTLTADGDLTIPGQLFTAGSCAAGCDRVFDADYPLPSIAEQAAMMRANKHLPAVGPTPEDGPFNITAMTGGMLNELEKAHLYIAALDAENRALRARMAAFEARLAALEAR